MWGIVASSHTLSITLYERSLKQGEAGLPYLLRSFP
jgi:hypothetical protein